MFRRAHHLIVIARAIAVAYTAACTTGTVARDATQRATAYDDYGDPIAISVPPQRIVSLNPTTTEILFAMGDNTRLIGRSHWDVWPDSAKFVPDLGNALRPNVEAVLAAHPDLVLLYASVDNHPAAQRLRAAGIPTMAFKVDRIADFDRATRLIGRVIGDSIHAAIVADSVRHTLDRVRAITAHLDHPTVVWPFAYRPAMIVGGGSFMNELLEIAGARNVYGELRDPAPIVPLEDIVRRNPRYVIRSVDMTQYATQPTQLDPAWRAIPAVLAGRIMTAPATLVSRPSVQLGEGAVALARLLHPGVVIP